MAIRQTSTVRVRTLNMRILPLPTEVYRVLGRRAASEEAAADRYFFVRYQQDDPAVGVGHAEREDLRLEWTNLPGREIDDGDDEPTLEVANRVVPGQLGGGGAGADVGSEVDERACTPASGLRGRLRR